MESESEIASLLREIRDQQRMQLERQAEAMALQREQLGLVKQQFDRAERIQTRAEALQVRAATAVRWILWLALPLLVLLAVIVIQSGISSLLHR